MTLFRDGLDWEREGATGIFWVEAKDAAKHSAMHRTVSHNQGLSDSNASTAKTEMILLD